MNEGQRRIHALLIAVAVLLVANLVGSLSPRSEASNQMAGDVVSFAVTPHRLQGGQFPKEWVVWRAYADGTVEHCVVDGALKGGYGVGKKSDWTKLEKNEEQ